MHPHETIHSWLLFSDTAGLDVCESARHSPERNSSKRSIACTKRYPDKSAAWCGCDDRVGFIHRGWMRNQGFPGHVFDPRPVIGVCNTWSELTPCKARLRALADQAKRGMWEAGGLPLEFPVMFDWRIQSSPLRDAASQFGQPGRRRKHPR